MRVLFVTSSYPFHSRDVHALFVHHMARAYVQRGDSVRVLTLAVPEQERARESWDGVDVERVAYPGPSLTGGAGIVGNARQAPWRMIAAPAIVAALGHAVRSEARRAPPDAIVAHWLVPGGVAASLWRAPTAVIAHGSDVHLLARVPGGRAIVEGLRMRGRIVCTSAFLRDRMRSARLIDRDDDVDIATLGVRGPPELAPLPATPLRVAWMGRMVPGKGALELVDAVARTADVHATLAGMGPLHDEIRARIAALGVAARVVVRGPVGDDEKRAFFAAHHVFAFVPPAPHATDFQDNLPVVCLEALAHGVPLVATRVGALPDLLSNGGGILVDDQHALTRVLAADYATTFGRMRAAAHAVGARHTWKAFLAAVDRALATSAGRSPTSSAR